MKPILAIIAVAALLASHPAHANKCKRIHEQVTFSTAGDGFYYCSAMYTFLGQCMRNTGDEKSAKRFEDAATMLSYGAVHSYAVAGINDEATANKIKGIARAFIKSVDGSCSNVAATFNKLGSCKARLESPDEYIKRIANRIAKHANKARECK